MKSDDHNQKINSATDYIKVAKEIFYSSMYNKYQWKAVDRLFEYEDSLQKWRYLSTLDFVKHNIDQPDNFNYEFRNEDIKSIKWWNELDRTEKWRWLCCDIGSSMNFSYLHPRYRLNKKQINDSARKASRLAIQLARHIDDHFNLNNISILECLDEESKNALNIARELYLQELDSRFKEKKEITHAYRTMKYGFGSFSNMLMTFSKKAEESGEIYPEQPTSNPNLSKYEAKIFSQALFSTFQHFYGRPLEKVVISFVSAVFDREFSEHTVNEWRKDQLKVN